VPVIFTLKTEGEREIYFLIQESFFPLEGVQLLKTRLTNHIKFSDSWTRAELIIIAENTIEEYGGTIVPFTLFNVKY
jgi:hypothetical protein